MKSTEKNLRTALWANFIFSGSSSLFFLFFHRSIATWMPLAESWIILVIAIGLLLFAGFILSLLKAPTLSRPIVKSIIVLDWLWVLGSVLIVVFQVFNFRSGAYVSIVAIALVVMVLAIWQGFYIKKLKV